MNNPKIFFCKLKNIGQYREYRATDRPEFFVQNCGRIRGVAAGEGGRI